MLTRQQQIALAIYTAGVERSRRAYHMDPTAEQQEMRLAKAARKAAAQQRYRDRIKEQK